MTENKADYAIKGMEREQRMLGRLMGDRRTYTQRIANGGWH